MLRQMRNKLKMSYLSSVSVLFFILLLDTRTILADYENTFSSYYEQPCCNGPHHLRHHKGKQSSSTSFNLINIFSPIHPRCSLLFLAIILLLLLLPRLMRWEEDERQNCRFICIQIIKLLHSTLPFSPMAVRHQRVKEENTFL
jgi:hypothetical protein